MKFALLSLLSTGLALAAPEVVDDVALRAGFQKNLGEFAESGDHPTPKKLSEQLAAAPVSLTPPAGSRLADKPPASPADGVFLIGSVYKCGKCDHWHLGGVASAWALGRDGLMVTNHHVFAKPRGEVMGVSDRHGKVYPVTEILAADPDADTALFRVAADDLVALPIGPAPEIGSEVEVISHPHNRFFMHTFGRVSRYFAAMKRPDGPKVTQLAITADYAKGSSGGPVLDTEGRVVGMVSSTQSIYYGSDNGEPKGPLQMVLKNCVPAGSLAALVGREAAATASQR